MSKIQVKIFNIKTGEVRYVFAGPGDIVPIRRKERVMDFYPVGVIKDGDPVLTMALRGNGITAEESEYLVWDTRKTPEIER